MAEICTPCPCCGQDIEAYPLDRMAAIVTPLMGEVVTRLQQCPGEFVPMDEIVRWAFRRDPHGGPEDGKVSIANTITYNRRRLNALGWDIVGRKGRIGGLRLVAFNNPERRT